MPSRRRLGVAVVPDPPASDEIQGLRRALGDPSLGRVPPHLTLVPPVNVRASDFGAALEVVRSAAAAQRGPMRLSTGPPATFLPDNPVLFLEVGGDLDRLRSLRDAVFRPPLERKLSWPWVPHFTLGDGIDEQRIQAALVSLDRYASVVSVDRVVVLEESGGRVWRPIADARLGPPAVVGTGGLAITVTTGRLPDPLLAEAISTEFPEEDFWAGWIDTVPPCPPYSCPIVLTALRGGVPIGGAAIRTTALGPAASVFVDKGTRGEGIGGHLLTRLESEAIAAGWDLRLVTGIGPAGFYEARSPWIRSGGTAGEPSGDVRDRATRTRLRRKSPTS